MTMPFIVIDDHSALWALRIKKWIGMLNALLRQETVHF